MDCCESQDLNFSAVLNNDVPVQLNVTKKSDGLPLNLTGCYMEVSAYLPNTTTTAFSYDTDDGGVLFADQTTSPGVAVFTINAADTQGKPSGTYLWDGVIVTAAGKVFSIRNDNVYLSPGAINFTPELTVQP